MGQMFWRRPAGLAPAKLTVAGLVAAALLAGTAPTHAADGATDGGADKNPCAYQQIDIDKYGGALFKNPKPIRSQNGVLRTSLRVAYANHEIAGCPVRLRNYNGALVGPTLRVKPGDTLFIRMGNELPDNPGPKPDDPNIPHNFNTTNLHTHGLHVSPSGISDNVLRPMEPGGSYMTQIEIPADHPPGTFWYHAHMHGSTALQVSSGMAGALIIEGGLDDVPAIRPTRDHVFVFQQIAYDTKGVIENYDHFGQTGWADSKRHTLINAQLVPTIRMRPGQVQRWRFIHAGIRETITPVLRNTGRAPDAIADLGSFSSAELSQMDTVVQLHELAVDGLALGRIDSWKQIELQPGYRSDVVVKAPDVTRPTLLLLTDGGTVATESLLGGAEPERILARVVVAGTPDPMPLPTNAEVAGLAPHAPITELTGAAQKVEFNIGARTCQPGQPCQACEQGTPGCKTRFMINDRPFDLDNVRKLKLNTASEWTLSSEAGSHPFHIHVNPFQVTRAGPDGQDQIVWRDTLFVRGGQPPRKVRSRYTRFTGKFVIHCHILDHEDQGMMQVVEIVE